MNSLINDILAWLYIGRKFPVGFFDGLRNIKNQINMIESAVYSSSSSFLEIYEKNAQLELEIKERTKELDTANKQMLTLQHIWDMMNSSKPISSVLNAIVNSLKGELGYLHSCIAKNILDNDENFMQLVACSEEFLKKDFMEFFNCNYSDLKLSMPQNDEIITAIKENRVYQSQDIFSLLKAVFPDLSEELIRKVLAPSKVKSYILIPLSSKNVHFGSLVVFSSRAEATDSELNFLSLFAKQIELAITIADLFQAVKEQAVTDSMTGLYNRRYFDEFIKKEAERSIRQGQKFTVIGVDLDHLKQINDVYGHNYGDIAIKTIAEVLKRDSRSIDVAARMGGEEFNIVLPGIDSNGGFVVAERIRSKIESIKLDKIGNVTASVGVATYMEHSDDLDELLEIVDQAMYESKRNGRNRVTMAKKMTEVSWQDVAINTFVDIIDKHRIPIDEKIYTSLNKKLKEININNEGLYQISDELIGTYNPEHKSDGTKNKVRMATLLAKSFDLSKENQDKLKIAILLYDIGNTMLPKELLNKKEPLTEEDRLFIKKHPVIAAKEILEPIDAVGEIIPIIERHHENWDGTGYPNKISGENIPIESQIILIVDSYFALLEKRPYREAMSKDEAIKIILDEAGNKWSKDLANSFADIVNNELE